MNETKGSESKKETREGKAVRTTLLIIIILLLLGLSGGIAAWVAGNVSKKT